MTSPSSPQPLDGAFAARLRSSKADVVTGTEQHAVISQLGAASLPMDGWPGWPQDLRAPEPVIETYVAGVRGVTPTSENEPFVSAWTPLMEWLNETVRSQLSNHGVELSDDAYGTASLTATDLLEGTAHMDDDTFVPAESVQIVAIVGELAGPRVAIGELSPGPLRPMSQVIWHDDQLAAFETNRMEHSACPPDQLVIFAQFGQLHAGPAAEHVAELSTHRQLLVYRAAVKLD